MGGCAERPSVPAEEKLREKDRLEAERLMLEYYKQCAQEGRPPDASITPGQPKPRKSFKSNTLTRGNNTEPSTGSSHGQNRQGPDETDDLIALMFKSKKAVEPFGVHSSDILDKNHKPLPPRLARPLASPKVRQPGEPRMTQTQEYLAIEEGKRPDSPIIDSLGAHFRSAKIKSSKALRDVIPKLPVLTQIISPTSMVREKKLKGMQGDTSRAEGRRDTDKQRFVGKDDVMSSENTERRGRESEFKNNSRKIGDKSNEETGKQFELSVPRDSKINIVNSEFDIENEEIYISNVSLDSNLREDESPGIGVSNLIMNTESSISSSNHPYNQKGLLNTNESNSEIPADSLKQNPPIKKYLGIGLHIPSEINKVPSQNYVNMASPSESPIASNNRASDKQYRDAGISSPEVELMSQRLSFSQAENVFGTNSKSYSKDTGSVFISPERSDKNISSEYSSAMGMNKDREMIRSCITPSPNYDNTPERKVESYKKSSDYNTVRAVRGSARPTGTVVEDSRISEGSNGNKEDIYRRSSVASIPDIRRSIGSYNNVRRLHYLRNPPGLIN